MMKEQQKRDSVFEYLSLYSRKKLIRRSQGMCWRFPKGGSLMAIQSNDLKITLVAKGTEEQDCAIAEHVVSVFEELAGK